MIQSGQADTSSEGGGNSLIWPKRVRVMRIKQGIQFHYLAS